MNGRGLSESSRDGLPGADSGLNDGLENGGAKYPDCRFPRKERLKGRDEIREVFNRRKSVSCPGLKLLARGNGLSHNRIAFTFSRKFGNAVERNRSRRLSREAYRHLRDELRQGYDLVLLVYPGRDLYPVRLDQLRELFSRAGLFKFSRALPNGRESGAFSKRQNLKKPPQIPST